jgi:galactokinase
MLSPGSGDWAGYAAGVVWAMQQRGVAVPGLGIEVDSTVPSGSGLSSSAALTCSVATALNDLLELSLGGDDLLALTRQAENDFVGAPTGGLDQLAALRSRAGSALFCDMRALTTELVPLPLQEAGLEILVVDTRAEHGHATGEYGSRRRGCERAAHLLGVASLRDVTLDDLDGALARLDDEQLVRYTRHQVTENARVVETRQLLENGDIEGIGPLLTASHASLRDDYRVTIPELDTAVDALLGAGALGARMTGGGFGGSVIGLLPEDAVERAGEAVVRTFADAGWREPVARVVHPADGASRV